MPLDGRRPAAGDGATKAADPMMGYRIVERTRSQLVYTAPDGTPMKEWSTITEVESRKLARGDRPTAVADPDDYADIRHSYDGGELREMFAILMGSVVAMLVGWIFNGAGQSGRLPGPFWTRRWSS